MELVVMDNQGGNTVMREYRKGNWTVQETVVLIEAKKMDDERRMKRHKGESSSSSELGRGGSGVGGGKPAELRWKWVEDYCWRNGCLRSQNQCNDKWDNLMRDFKKVRDYERRLINISAGGEGDHESLSAVQSYWKIEKNERKEKNLPSNMLPQIYEALVEVVERKKVVCGGSGNSGNPTPTPTPTPGNMIIQPPPLISPPPVQQHPISAAPLAVLPLPPPFPSLLPQSQSHPSSVPYAQPLPTMCDPSDSDTSEYPDSPAKRRRRGRGEGTSTAATAGGTTSENEVGSAISKSATIIAEAIHASEEREERRHRDLLSLHERRLQIEESKAETNRQGINGLVDAINKLANSIHAMAAHKNQAAPK
ncbi:hypothetical protein RJ639_021844 [Escallonia herrerae]|uniref:Myb-like domain-containing protein n=1 Tax=Escallonia herrerae TaxID=1293975 RepID=A0AA89AHK3_9ASTE|nr:hypothetical protein RJ639_021844 [Escallonia herrerae]